jgi:hypothetical protein
MIHILKLWTRRAVPVTAALALAVGFAGLAQAHDDEDDDDEAPPVAHMLDRMADAIGAQTMGIIAGLMWESIVESITTGTQRLGIIMVRLTMAHLGIIGGLTMEPSVLLWCALLTARFATGG